jgi:hypothetical protein
MEEDWNQSTDRLAEIALRHKRSIVFHLFASPEADLQNPLELLGASVVAQRCANRAAVAARSR